MRSQPRKELARVKKELRELKKMFSLLETSHASTTDLAAHVAHQIKNPLALIIVSLQYLKGEFNPAKKKLLQTVLNKVEVLGNLAANLSSFAHDKPITMELTKINDLVETNIKAVLPQCRRQEIEVQRVYSGLSSLVEVDRALMSTAFLNILNNSIEAMPRGGSLKIETHQLDGKEAMVRITDTGAGIAQKNLEKILTPFYTTKKGHSGLGLSVAQRIVLRHGGQIRLKSKNKNPNKGSVCLIYLPSYTKDPWWKKLFHGRGG